jgi:hypothetical protein
MCHDRYEHEHKIIAASRPVIDLSLSGHFNHEAAMNFLPKAPPGKHWKHEQTDQKEDAPAFSAVH